MTTLSFNTTAPATRSRNWREHLMVGQQWHAEQKAQRNEVLSAASEDKSKARQAARNYLDESNISVKLGRAVDAWCSMHPETASDEDIPYLHLCRFSFTVDTWSEDIEPVYRQDKARFQDIKKHLPVVQLREKVRELLVADVECVLGKLHPDEIAAFLEMEPQD